MHFVHILSRQCQLAESNITLGAYIQKIDALRPAYKEVRDQLQAARTQARESRDFAAMAEAFSQAKDRLESELGKVLTAEEKASLESWQKACGAMLESPPTGGRRGMGRGSGDVLYPDRVWSFVTLELDVAIHHAQLLAEREARIAHLLADLQQGSVQPQPRLHADHEEIHRVGQPQLDGLATLACSIPHDEIGNEESGNTEDETVEDHDRHLAGGPVPVEDAESGDDP